MDIIIVNDSALNTNAEVIVNAANKHLLAGGGICGAIFSQAGKNEYKLSVTKSAIAPRDLLLLLKDTT